MRKCHGDHMKVQKDRIKVTVTIAETQMYLIAFLADRYADGCLAAFIREAALRWVKANHQQDIKEIQEMMHGKGAQV